MNVHTHTHTHTRTNKQPTKGCTIQDVNTFVCVCGGGGGWVGGWMWVDVGECG